MTRIEQRINNLKTQKKSGLVAFVTAGDPDLATSLEILKTLSESGADIIEIGMPFSDPMADGPTIQRSSHRALANGITVKKTLTLVKDFRKTNQTTPIILMGYFNPILNYGIEKFAQDAKKSGVDGLIIVDLPPEESNEITPSLKKHKIDFIRLIAPTSDAERIQKIAHDASGFLYYISIAGITGTKSADLKQVQKNVTLIRKISKLPIAIGFGIKTAKQAKESAKVADLIVVGSAFCQIVEDNLDNKNKISAKIAQFCRKIKP
jgi:tryptophan synthase alpha chain